jgi:hypothetical protein
MPEPEHIQKAMRIASRDRSQKMFFISKYKENQGIRWDSGRGIYTLSLFYYEIEFVSAYRYVRVIEPDGERSLVGPLPNDKEARNFINTLPDGFSRWIIKSRNTFKTIKKFGPFRVLATPEEYARPLRAIGGIGK